MHRLKEMKDCLVSCVQAQLADIKNVDTKELGEAIDMIKDLEEAMYYCSITKAMKEQEKESKMPHCHIMPYPVDERDMDREHGKMYYSDRSRREPYHHDMMEEEEYREREMPIGIRDEREGRSPISRRHYMESKEMHHAKEKKIKELDKYMQELTQDIVEMIDGASPEEKQMLEKKMTHLTSKIAQLNQNV